MQQTPDPEVRHPSNTQANFDATPGAMDRLACARLIESGRTRCVACAGTGRCERWPCSACDATGIRTTPAAAQLALALEETSRLRAELREAGARADALEVELRDQRALAQERERLVEVEIARLTRECDAAVARARDWSACLVFARRDPDDARRVAQIEATLACGARYQRGQGVARPAPIVETIRAAAVRHDGVVYWIPRPGRHHEILRAMVERGLPGEATRLAGQGFLTSLGRFVRRGEAAEIARAAGQLLREPTPAGMLTSEDVW